MPAKTGRKDYIDMENTRENVVNLLKKMAENNHVIADGTKYSDPEFSKIERRHAMDYELCIFLLTDPKYFNTIYKIYNKEVAD